MDPKGSRSIFKWAKKWKSYVSIKMWIYHTTIKINHKLKDFKFCIRIVYLLEFLETGLEKDYGQTYTNVLKIEYGFSHPDSF